MINDRPRCCAESRAVDIPTTADAAAREVVPSEARVLRRRSPLIGGGFLMGTDDRRFPDGVVRFDVAQGTA